MLPLLVPAVPFGLIIGIAVVDSALIPDWAGWASAPVVFAGASQLTAITLLAEGSGAWAALLAGLTVNARHLMYSAALVPRFREQPSWFRWVAPYFLVDQMFALATTTEEESASRFRAMYLGAGTLAFCLWTTSVAAGILLGPMIPDGLDISFLVPVMFTGLLVPTLTRRPAVVGALTAVAVTAALADMPNRGGLLVGAVAGTLAAFWAERWNR